MINKKLGFTLIELLAVVLIISILTTVAVPQYRRSIQRAEAIEAMINLRALFDSAKRYKAANSEVPTQLKGLDVTFFDATAEDGDFTLGKFDYGFDSTYVKACRHNGNYCLYMYYNNATYGGRDVTTCEYTPGGKYDFVCPALGQTEIATNVWVLK